METPSKPTHVFEMLEEDNPRFYELFKEGESLINRAHEMNDDLLALTTPIIRLRSGRKKLNEVVKKIAALHRSYADWEIDVVNFLLYPAFPNIRAPDPALYVLHFTSVLRDQIQRVTEEVNVPKASFMNRDQQLVNQETRVYAILALIVSFAGTVLSALAFWGATATGR